jgi:hypothetical protein
MDKPKRAEPGAERMISEGGVQEGVDQAAVCARCGMAKAEWSAPKGVTQDEDVFCCGGCAEGKGCTCEQDKLKKARAGRRH